MENKVRNLIIILVVLLVVIGVVWVMMRRSAKQPSVTDVKQITPTSTTEAVERETIQENLAKKIEGKSEAEISDQAAILKVARYFVERYGSFSSQARWQNLEDLREVVTDKLWQDFEDLLNKDVSSSEYYSLSTKVLSLDVLSLTSDRAEVVASTQRREAKGGEENISYQKMKVNLVKIGGKWLVDDVSKQDNV